MALKRITEEEMNAQGVVAAPDILNGTAAQNKAIFDRMVRSLVAPAVNACADAVEELQDVETGIRENEETRVEAEAQRVEAELLRAEAESNREAQEAQRVINEANRNFWDDFDESVEYLPGNKVVYYGSSYININACRGVTPEDPYYWRMIARKGADAQGDMKKEVYDPQGKAQDVFSYVDQKTEQLEEGFGAEKEDVLKAAEEAKAAANNAKTSEENAQKSSENASNAAEYARNWSDVAGGQAVRAENAKVAAENANSAAESSKKDAESAALDAKNAGALAQENAGAAANFAGSASGSAEAAQSAAAAAAQAASQAAGTASEHVTAHNQSENSHPDIREKLEELQESANNGSAGGVTSWDDLTEKPFGETILSSEMNFAETPADTFDVAGYSWWKVSDLTPTTKQLLTADIAVGSANTDGENIYQLHWTPTAEEVIAETETITGVQSASYGTGFLVCRAAGEQTAEFSGYSFTFTVPSAGVYFGYEQGAAVPASTAVAISYEEIKLLDAKFLPMDEIKEAVAPKVTSIDLTNFESNGTIVETYADGSTVTYTVEADANGNPIKITDSNGNETVLTW